MTLAIAIFVVALAVVASDSVHRAKVALIGAYVFLRRIA
jgi:hypothetical protein